MSDPTIIQRYSSLSQFVLEHRLLLPKPRDGWRLLQRPCLGSVAGLSSRFHGIAMATNGIMVAILDSGKKIVYGHIQWFEKDDEDYETDLDDSIGDNLTAEEKFAKGLAEYKARTKCIATFANLYE